MQVKILVILFNPNVINKKKTWTKNLFPINEEVKGFPVVDFAIMHNQT